MFILNVIQLSSGGLLDKPVFPFKLCKLIYQADLATIGVVQIVSVLIDHFLKLAA